MALQQSTSYSSPIQELVKEYQQKGHVVPQDQYPEPVLKAIQKNFEHNKNIFEQFVSFDEGDKAFVPNKEVFSSDWSAQNRPGRPTPLSELSPLADKVLVYQTFPPTPATPAPAPAAAGQKSSSPAPSLFSRNKAAATFPHERNAEGGFRPMLRPLHSPLLS